jgi:hypothetical protein
MAEVIKSKFLREFQRNLFPDNSFWMRGRSDSGADEFTTIQIPQAAAQVTSTFGTIQSGQANLATANSLAPLVRLNNTGSYTIETFGTNPVALQLSDLDSISYDKRQELFLEHQQVISTNVANFTAIAWAQDTANTAFIVQTTGTAVRANIVTGGLVDDVKTIAKDDIINVKRLFHRMNISNIPGQIYALITPEQWDDLLKIDGFVDYDKSGNESKLVEGTIGRLLGIDFLIPRHNPALNANVLYNATNQKIAFGAAATNGRSAAIFFHSGLVRYAQGSGMLYERRNDPIFKADIMSADVRFGATKSRTDGVGVVSLVEAATP